VGRSEPLAVKFERALDQDIGLFKLAFGYQGLGKQGWIKGGVGETWLTQSVDNFQHMPQFGFCSSVLASPGVNGREISDRFSREKIVRGKFLASDRQRFVQDVVGFFVLVDGRVDHAQRI
jgi:hypothetical protein